MLKKDFWYDLPKELIAQEPADPRDSARKTKSTVPAALLQVRYIIVYSYADLPALRQAGFRGIAITLS